MDPDCELGLRVGAKSNQRMVGKGMDLKHNLCQSNQTKQHRKRTFVNTNKQHRQHSEPHVTCGRGTCL